MGKQAVILVLGVLLAFTVYSTIFNTSNSDVVKNYSNSYASIEARNITRSALEMTLGVLADSIKWRQGYSNLKFMGGTATVTLQDTIVKGDSAIRILCVSRFVSGRDTAVSVGRVVVEGSLGFIPIVVRAAFTAFGSINAVISDMVIDGRNFNSDGVTLVPLTGKFGVSTGQSSFTNNQHGAIGATAYIGGSPLDIPPAYPNDPRVIETSSPWPNGFPKNADQALELPPGTLENIAKNNLISGSQYVTKASDLRFPLKGVTYIKVPPRTVWSKIKIGANPEGILVFHSDSTDAYWNNISTTAGPFKGVMVFDNVFHIHMDITGAIAVLTPNTITNQECKGNNGHKILYSAEAIKAITGGIKKVSGGGWREKLKLISWSE
jgi:hypothetical protein